MAVRDEYQFWHYVGVGLAGALLLIASATGVLPESSRESAARAVQGAPSSPNRCGRIGGDEIGMVALYDTCWVGQSPSPAPAVQERALFECAARLARFQVQYQRSGTLPGGEETTFPPYEVQDLITPGTVVDAGAQNVVFEVDFSTKTFRLRGARDEVWRLNDETGTDEYRIESGSPEYVCFDHAILPPRAAGAANRTYFCATGIDLRSLRYELLSDVVPTGRQNDAALTIPPPVATRGSGACRRTNLPLVRQGAP